MKLPADAIIARRKVDEYLLRCRNEDDKSGSLARGGYTLENADLPLRDLRDQLLPRNAEVSEQTEYGPKYRIRGMLKGPNGNLLRVLSIWMNENATGETKSVTFLPDKA